MRLKNTSKYPTEEVRRLVAFATKGVRLDRVAVHVKNHKGSYRGMAYVGVPFESPRYGQKTVDRLVTIGIGTRFPEDNMVTSYRKTKWSEKIGREELRDNPPTPPGEGWEMDTLHWAGEPTPDPERPGWMKQTSDGPVQYRWVRKVRHPYGGERSPLIEVRDWREALVAVAAHEARHVQQYQRRKPRSEVDAERFAAKRLEEYRARA